MLIGLCKLSFERSQIEYSPGKTDRNNRVELGTKSCVYSLKFRTFNLHNRQTFTEAFIILMSTFFDLSVSL